MQEVAMASSNYLFAQQKPERVSIGDVPIDIVTQKQAVQYVDDLLLQNDGTKIRISGVNAHFVNLSSTEKRLARFLQANTLNVADGTSILMAAWLFKHPISERITGIDFMIDLCGYAAEKGLSIYLLGGMEGAAARTAELLQMHHPALKIAGVDRPAYGKETDPAVAEQIRERIRVAQPDFLFVCMGVPRQEYWIEQYTMDLPVRLVMGNGAAFDVMAGYFTRPSKRIQSLGLEWAYRLWKEPARLWRRYLIGNLAFSLAVLGQYFAGMITHPRTTESAGS